MDCPEENVIVDFVRGELDKSERAAIESHIDSCGACGLLVAEMARIFQDERPSSVPRDAPLSGPTNATEGAFSPSTVGTGMPTEEPSLPQGSKLGRYVVINRVGAGGMGVVYAAYDPELDRKVAVKVLRSASKKAGGGRNEQSTRLIREAQAMAKLSHPNVIAVHDVGTFDEQVFLAMEFIDGGTLGQWLSAEKRSWREVLKVFRAAGEGLDAAHAVGLVHRDFKPENVLIGRDGRVLVTDFGLARPAKGSTGRFTHVADAHSGQAVLGASLTQTGALVGTPAYMAPEQLHGRSTNALTDQFSFCVALYEGLYGERPFEGGALVELMHNVTEGLIRAAPRDASVPKWVRRAVLRGLSTEPKDRFPTMRALLTALRRDPWLRWRRWGAVTIPTAVLAIGVVAYQQVERPPTAACDDVEDMLAGVWDDDRKERIESAFAATNRAYAVSAFALAAHKLDGYAQDWVAMRTEVCREEHHAETPQAVTALRSACLDRRRTSIETIVDLLEEPDTDTVVASVDAVDALPPLEMCADIEALTERSELLDAEARAAADEIDRLSVRARILVAAAKYEDALELADRIVETSRAAGYRRGEAEGLYVIGRAKLLQGDREAAETALHRALSAALAAGHSLIMARASVGLVWISAESGRPLDEAERWAAHGLAALEQSGAPARIAASLYQALASARMRAGKFDAADEALSRGLEVLEKAGSRNNHAGLITTRGSVRVMQGRTEEALALFEQAAQELAEQYGEQHPNVATSLDNVGTAMARLGRLDEALAKQQLALEIREQALPANHVNIGGSHQNLSITLTQLGDLDGALEHADKAVEIMRAGLGTQSLELASALSQLGAVHRARKEYPAALDALREGKAMVEAVAGKGHPRASLLTFQLGLTLLAAEHYEEAEHTLQEVLAQREAAYGAEHGFVGAAATELAVAKLALAKNDEAQALAERALKIVEADDPEGPDTAYARFTLARALWNSTTPDHARALSLAEKARDYYDDADPAQAVRVGAWLGERG